MANLFSTATLGLKVDTKQFNKAIADTGFATNDVLKGMALSAADFEAKIDSATEGIKDTKRIISGILVSRGFYSLLEGLTTGASAALTFAENMETASVSMQYFMEGANKADKAVAFISTMQDFAAKTPFTTEQAMSMAKYIQSMGVSAKNVKSYLGVVTDAAAATGASAENLQRITLALGQMMTKGRLANEEIRQLANANIPIYDILKEELKLTGTEISNIGTKWVSADKAVVAILNGLEKRYDGAADKISNTVTGMVDTIVDDLKIVSSKAGNFIYEGIATGVTNVRDLLEEYREIVTQFGAAGLAQHIMLQIDPTGGFAREVLITIGNIKNLGGELSDLYQAAKPLIGLFGQSLYTSFNLATITLSSFTHVVTGVLDGLAKLGITTGDVAEVLSSLFIAYQASKWMITLGEGAYYAAASVYQTVTSITQILPATMAANAGLITLTAGLAGVVAAGVGIYAMVSNLSGLSGLSIGEDSTVSSDWDAAYADLQKQMKDYYDQLQKNSDEFEGPFSDIDSEADDAKDAVDSVATASKKAAKKSKQEWLASFDEVFAIPKDTTEATKPKFPDLSTILEMPKFKFPEIKAELKVPELNTDDIWKDTTANPDVLTKILPYLITTGVIGAVPALFTTIAKAKPGDLGGTKTGGTNGGNGPKNYGPDTKITNIDTYDKVFDVDGLKKTISAFDTAIKKADDDLVKTTEEVKRLREADKDRLGAPDNALLEAKTHELEYRIAKVEETVSLRNQRSDVVGEPRAESTALAAAQEEKRISLLYSIDKKISAVSSKISKLKQAPNTTAKELEDLNTERTRLLAERKKLNGGSLSSVDIAGRTKGELEDLFNHAAQEVSDKFENAFGRPYSGDVFRYSNQGDVEEAYKAFDNLILLGDKLSSFDYFSSVDTIAKKLYLTLKASEKDLRICFEKLVLNTDALAIELYRLDKSLGGKKFAELPQEMRDTIKQLQEKADTYDKRLRQVNGELDSYFPDRKTIRDAKRSQQAANKNKLPGNPNKPDASTGSAKLPTPPKKPNPPAEAAKLPADEAKKLDEGVAAQKETAENTKEISNNTDTTTSLISDLKDEYAKYSAANVNNADAIDALATDIHDTVTELIAKGYDTNNLVADLGDEAAVEVKNIYDEMTLEAAEQKVTAQKIVANTEKTVEAIKTTGYKLGDALLDGIKESDAVVSKADSVKQAINAGYTKPDYYLSGTKVSTVRNGIDAWGRDMSALAADVHSTEANTSSIKAIAQSLNTRISSYEGNWLEDIVFRVAVDSVDPSILRLSRGGYKGLPNVPATAQIDTVGALLLKGSQTFEIVSNDIKTKTGQLFDDLFAASTEYANGVRTIPAELLKTIAPEHFYQFALQAFTMNGGKIADAHVGMSAFNRDFDFSTVDTALVKRWKDALEGVALPKDIAGKIFSSAAIKAYGDSLSLTSASDMVKAYFENIVEKTFTKAGEIDLTPLKAAFQQYVIEYPAEALKNLDLGTLAKQYYEYNELLGTVMKGDNVGKFIKSYVAFNTSLGEQVIGLNFANKLRYVSSLEGGVEKWFENLSKVTGETYDYGKVAGTLSVKIRRAVDDIVETYIANFSAAGTKEEAAAIIEATRKKLVDFATTITDYVSGNEIGDATELFKGVKKSKGLTSLADALLGLSEHLDAYEELPRAINSSIEGITKVNKALSSVTDATVETLTSLLSGEDAVLSVNKLYGTGNNITRAFQLLGVTTDEVTLQTIRQLEKVYTTSKAISDAAKEIYAALDHESKKYTSVQQIFEKLIKDTAETIKKSFGQLEQVTEPFRNLGIIESMPYATHDIHEGIISQELTLSADSEDAFKKIIDAAGEAQTANITGALKQIIPSRFIIDLETSGLPELIDGAWKFPSVVQVSLIDAQTKEIRTWFVNYGEAQNAANLAAYKAAVKVPSDILVEQLNAGKDLVTTLKEVKEIVGDLPVGGYNATNFSKIGGAFDAKIIEDAMGKGFLTWSTDTYQLLVEKIYELTGKHISLKLGEAIQVVTKDYVDGLHNADADVAGALKVNEVVLSNGLSGVVDAAKKSGDLTKTGLVDTALELGKAVGKFTGELKTINVADAADFHGIAVKIKDVANALQFDPAVLNLDGLSKAADTAKDAVKAAEGISDFTSGLGKVDDALKALNNTKESGDLLDQLKNIFKDKGGFVDIDWFADAFKQASERAGTTWKTAKRNIQKLFTDVESTLKSQTSFSHEDLLKAFNAMDESKISADAAAKAFEDLSKQLEVARRLPGNAYVDDIEKAYNTAEKTLEDATKAHAKTVDTFYKDFIDMSDNALKNYNNKATNVIQLLFDKIDESDTSKYVATMYDVDTGTINKLTDTLFAPLTDIQKILRERINYQIFEALPKTSEGIVNELGNLVNGKVKFDDLSDISKQVYTAIDDLRGFLAGNGKQLEDLSPMAKSLKDAVEEVGGVLPTDMSDFGKLVDKILPINDILKNVEPEVLDYLKGVKNLDNLSEPAKAAAQAIKDIGGNIQILDTAKKTIIFAGDKMVAAVDKTHKALSISFETVAQKLTADFFGISVFDVLATVLSGVLQAQADKLKGTDLQTDLLNDSSTATITKILEEKGISFGEEINKYFSGVKEAVTEAAVSNIVGSVAGWATAKGVTGAITGAVANGKIGAALGSAAGPIGTVAGVVVGIVGSMLVDQIAKGMGSETDVAKYLDDYVKNRDELIATATSLGEQAGQSVADAMAAAEEAALIKLRDIGYSRGTSLEKMNTDAVLYGGVGETVDEGGINLNTIMNEIKKFVLSGTEDATTGKNYTSVPTDESLASRLSTVLDAINSNTELDDNSLATLSDYVKLIYEHGETTGYVSEEILAAVANNTDLQKQVNEKYGEQAQALALLPQYLKEYNEINDTNITQEEAERTGLMKEILAYVVKVYDATEAQKAAMVKTDSKVETKNRNILNGDVTSNVWGINPEDFKSVTDSTLKALSDFGIEVSTSAVDWSSELTGRVSEAFATIKFSSDKLKEHLAGWTIDTSKMSFNLGKATLSSDDVEILASAGIQINGDGTVTFMKAMNEAVTGTERSLTLDTKAFTQDIIDKLSGIKINLDFDAKKFKIDDLDTLGQKMTGALFKLPDNIDSQLNDQMRAMLESVGDIMDNGYLMITDKSVLSGQKTLEGYIEGLTKTTPALKEAYTKVIDPEGTLTAEEVEAKFQKAFGSVDIKNLISGNLTDDLKAIDDLIKSGTGTITQNIVEWANGVSIPSPIDMSEVTPEIEAAFKEINIEFQEYGDQTVMTLNDVGNHLSNGVTLVDKAKWSSMIKDAGTTVENAIKEAGVTWTDRGNQVAVDLSGTLDKGVDDIVALFVNQPDVWAQIPDFMKQLFEQTGAITNDEWIKISTALSGGITELADGWATAWEGLSNDTLKWQGTTVDGTTVSMEDLRKTVKDGILKIEQVTDDANVEELAKTNIVVPFDSLPDELKDALLATDKELSGKMVILKNTTETGMEDMVKALQDGADGANDAATDISKAADSIVTAMQKAFDNMGQLQQLQNMAGSSGGLFNKTKNQVVMNSSGTQAKEYDVNGNVVAIWDRPDTNSPWKKIGKSAKGGLASGLTLTGELGREMAILPDGTVKMLGADGKGELADLPKGTRVLNNKDTEDIIKYTGTTKPDITRYASGNTSILGAYNSGSIAQSANSLSSSSSQITNAVQQIYKDSSDVTSTVASAAQTVDEFLAGLKDSAGSTLIETQELTDSAMNELLRGILQALLNISNTIASFDFSGLSDNLSSSFSEASTNADGDIQAIYDSLKNGVDNIATGIDYSGYSDITSSLSDPLANAVVITDEAFDSLDATVDTGTSNITEKTWLLPKAWELANTLTAAQLATLLGTTDTSLDDVTTSTDEGSSEAANKTWILPDAWELAGTLTAEELARLLSTTDEGLSDITDTTATDISDFDDVLTDYDLGETIDTTFTQPLSELPDIVSDAFDDTDTTVQQALDELSLTFSSGFDAVVTTIDSSGNDISTAVSQINREISSAISETSRLVSELQTLASKASSLQNKAGSASYSVAAPSINHPFPSYSDYRGLATGGVADGLTLTGELGREMAILPNGEIRMLGANGKGELLDLPEGTRVLNNKDTEDIVKYTGTTKPGISKLAEGNVTVTDQGKFDDYMKKINDVLKKMSLSVKTQLATYQNNNVASADAGFTVLNSGKAVYDYTSKLGNGTINLSDSVDDSFANLNDLIKKYEQTTESDLVNWANAVVLPSPVKADEITPEMQEAFNEIEATFNAYSNELNTLVSSANELLVSNMAPESNKELLQAALTEMYDQVLEGTQKEFEDLKETIDDGIAEIKDSFTGYIDDLSSGLQDATETGLSSLSDYVDQYTSTLTESFTSIQDVFTTANDTVTTQFETMATTYETGFTTVVDQLTQFNTSLTEQFTVQQDTISTSMTAIGELFKTYPQIYTDAFTAILETYKIADTNTKQELATMKQSVDNGFQQIINGIQSKQGAMQSAVTTMFSGAITAMQNAAQQIQSTGQQILANISSIVSQAQAQLSNLRSMAAQAQSTASQIQATASRASSVSIPQLGLPKNDLYNVPYNADGGTVSGLSMVGEDGRELAVFKNGKTAILGQDGPQLVDLPSGTRIINNKDTEGILGYTGGVVSVPRFAMGTGITASQERDLERAYGNQNAVMQRMYKKSNNAAATDAQDLDSRVEGVVNKVLEVILPAIVGAKGSSDNRMIAQVGTLIADDRGLAELQRRMDIVKIKEGRSGR